MTMRQRRFWLWVNVVCLAIALVCIMVGSTLNSRPVFQTTLLVIGIVVLVFGVGSAVIVAVRVRRDQRLVYGFDGVIAELGGGYAN
jgi:uncharacterized membrane protein YhfC